LLPQISGGVSYSDSTNQSPVFAGDGFIIVGRDSESLGLDLTLDLSLYDHSNWLQLNRAEKVAQQSDASLAVALSEVT
jgi:outer membrane protein